MFEHFPIFLNTVLEKMGSAKIKSLIIDIEEDSMSQRSVDDLYDFIERMNSNIEEIEIEDEANHLSLEISKNEEGILKYSQTHYSKSDPDADQPPSLKVFSKRLNLINDLCICSSLYENYQPYFEESKMPNLKELEVLVDDGQDMDDMTNFKIDSTLVLNSVNFVFE